MVRPRIGATILALLLATASFAQAKKPLDHSVYDGWKSVGAPALSRDGRWLLYTVNPQVGDGELVVRQTSGSTTHTMPRATAARFSDDGSFVVATVVPAKADVDKAKKDKKKPEEMPKNALAILSLTDGEVRTIENVASWSSPRDLAGWIAYRLPTETAKPAPEGEKKDETKTEKRKDHRPGTDLHLLRLASSTSDKIEFVDQFTFTEDGTRLVFSLSTKDGAEDGLYVRDLASGKTETILKAPANYRQVAVNDKPFRVAFYTDKDDYKATKPQFSLYGAEGGRVRLLAKAGSAGIPEGLVPVERVRPRFSESGSRVFFGTAPKPEEEKKDETPEDEKPVLDVWAWTDRLIQPMQLKQVATERNRSFEAMVEFAGGKVLQLATPDTRTATIGDRGDGRFAVATDDRPYLLESSWNMGYNDVYLLDTRTGTRAKALERVRGGVAFSPTGKYLTWWNGEQGAWFAMDVARRTTVNLSATLPHPVVQDDHDTPNEPGSYGVTGWTQNDDRFLINDKFDVWATDPDGKAAPVCVTDGAGRLESVQLRVLRLDAEERWIDPAKPMLLSATNLETMAGGFYRDTFSSAPQRLVMMDADYGNPIKAKDADRVVVSRQTFADYPDLYATTSSFASFTRMSDANPQQKDYLWGDAELIDYRSMDGVPLKGVLIKPGGFEYGKRYPMLVYFYERLSNTLHQYRSPSPSGSSINPAFFASRGYVVFLPDIPYREGYPGESCYAAVMPGVQAVLDRGFVDPKRIGIQGHSWGGYQSLYLVTKTTMFACAEAGAAVSNMVSAYGGIRYGTGMSRMFQYEQTQSRIGASLWDRPLRFLENSPIFFADKVTTPLLLLHNDQDGAVPWTEGIQMFLALRRLAKPAWLVNYNGEDHGIGRRPNRLDWTVRMQQFFDHYLQGAPAPVWMTDGIPAVDKGRKLGLEPKVSKGGS
ncbi:MAG: S9 family peptidase [Fimbriimonadaceae bacterium]|nr:S9 family peptidase [Fimbriimonadaceae bacterium]